MGIAPNAVVAPGARLGNNVTVGPFAVIDENVVVGDNCVIGPHVYLTGHTTLGEGTKVHNGAVVGDAPQDLHYQGETTYVDIGRNCVIREYVTIHRGTDPGTRTVIGDNVMLMAFSHVGHNCQIANNVVVANATLLAGHVQVGERAFISANCMVHQFVRIGRLAMVGGGNAMNQDLPPFCLLQKDEVLGTNIVGLRRAGLSDTARNALHQAVKTYFFYNLPRMNAIEKIRNEVEPCPEIQEFIDFVMETKRGIVPGRSIEKKTP